MKLYSSRGGGTVFMLISIAILAAAIAVTLVFTLRSRQQGESASAPEGTAASTPFSPAKPSAGESAPSAKPRPDDGEQVEPDWMADELLLDELAEAPWTPAPDETGGGEPDAQTPPEATPPPTPAPSAAPSPTPAPTSFTNPFSDVKSTDYFYEPVMWAAQKGIVSGDTFSPGSACSRAQAITFLWRQQGEPEPKLKVSPFTDVSQSDYYYKPVLWAFENGLISTPADGKFKPNDPVNRAQVATFLYRVCEGSAAGLSNPYSNVRSSDYYYEAALWAYDQGIVILDGGETAFDATSPCTRAQYITFLYRCFAEGGA